MIGARSRAFRERLAEGGAREVERAVAVEEPCAVELNGLGYAVMMLTPEHLEDFAYGFCLSERLIDAAEDIVAVDTHGATHGRLLRIGTRPELRERVAERVRHRISDSSCGLCGIENLEQALRPLPRVSGRKKTLAPAAIFKALAAMRAHQPLNRATGAVHAAALCAEDGRIVLAREDVGRHNAFDKLVGAMLRAGQGWNDGFALLSSRCSYELVETAALSGCPTLVAVSAPTTLAITRAEEAGVELIALARPDSFLAPTIGTGPE